MVFSLDGNFLKDHWKPKKYDASENADILLQIRFAVL